MKSGEWLTEVAGLTLTAAKGLLSSRKKSKPSTGSTVRICSRKKAMSARSDSGRLP
ncbi:hypothetical protein D3C84_1022910 [compost metagenome]